jgi:hypothetical protein
MRMRPRVGWLMVAATLSWGVSAFAAAPEADRLKAAAEEFDSGRRYYKIRDFENAAIHFENADRDAPSPEALQSAVRARKEAGHTARAATLAALALSRYPSEKGLSDYARQVLSESERLLYRVATVCSPDCTVIVDNKVMPFPESANAVVYLDPGPHTVVAGWSNNRNKKIDVSAVAGSGTKLSFVAPALEKSAGPQDPASPPRDIDATLPPLEADTNQEKTKKSGLPPVVFFVGAGLTAVVGGVTIWSGVDTLSNPGTAKVSADCDGKYTNISDCPTYQLGLDHERRTNILIAATSVVGVTTAVIGLFFTNWGGDDSAKPDKKDAFIQPVVGFQDGVNVGAVGRF